ncbi:MAG: ChaN family lipoprotein [Desulfomonile tiedjei]|nr:ChaN family lipoprotein [Desulfomonile tiedjei]
MFRLAACLICLIGAWLTVTSTPAYAKRTAEFFIVDLLMGEPVPMEVMLDDLAQVRVIYVGEIHTIARHHQFQEALLQGLTDRGLKVALGLEMFTDEQQPLLDRWQRGTQPLESLRDDLGEDYWTNQKDYEPLLLMARERGVPILGLNAPSKLVRKVARQGLDGLTPAERNVLPSGLDRVDPLNDRLLRLRLQVHRAFQEKSLDRIVLAQALRDETMARAVARFLESPEGKDRIVLVVAGNGHVNYGFGIPAGVRRRFDVPSRTIVSSESGELVLSETEKRQSVPVEISHEDLRFIRVPIGDYLQLIPLREPGENLASHQ